MDYKALAAMKSQIKSSPQRTQKPGTPPQATTSLTYEDGIKYLTQAQHDLFQNKSVLYQAFQAFKTTVQNSPYDPRPYLALTYLMILVGDFGYAKQLLLEVKTFAPNHADLAVLSDYLQTCPQPQDIPVTHIDFDALYDRLEVFIFAQIRQLTASQNEPLTATANAKDYQLLENKYQNLSQVYQIIKKQLTIVDEEIDTSDLRKNLKPIDSILVRYQNLLTIFSQITLLKQRIENEISVIDNQIKEAQIVDNNDDLVVLEENMEIIRDNLDGVGSQMNELESHGHNISILEKSYHQWIKLIDQFDELIESLSEQLLAMG